MTHLHMGIVDTVAVGIAVVVDIVGRSYKELHSSVVHMTAAGIAVVVDIVVVLVLLVVHASRPCWLCLPSSPSICLEPL